LNEQQAIVTPHASLAWADRLRNLATLMVIGIHVSGSVAQGDTSYNTWYWWSANLWDSLCRPAVPLFIMLSGSLLLGKDYPLGDFLKRRFTRVLIPALFWMIVFSFYNYQAHNDPATLYAAFKNIVERNVHYHLWFIYLIIGLYLLYPILRPWIRSAREPDYWYFFAVCVLGTWVYKILAQFFDLHIGLYFELFTNQAGTFVLGYYMAQKLPSDHPDAPGPGANIAPWRLNTRQLVWLAIGLIVVSTAATAIGSWWGSLAYGNTFFTYFYDYLTPNVGIGTIGWFLLAQLTLQKATLLDIEKEFAAASFGIYFVHVLALDWWSRVGYWSYKYHPAVCIPVIICLVTMASFLAIILIRGLPGGKKIT
jgi:surface polysaccharide O-acyltransferase-like enzyme